MSGARKRSKKSPWIERRRVERTLRMRALAEQVRSGVPAAVVVQRLDPAEVLELTSPINGPRSRARLSTQAVRLAERLHAQALSIPRQTSTRSKAPDAFARSRSVFTLSGGLPTLGRRR